MSAGYPRNLQYLAKRLNGYSRSSVRLNTLNMTTATPGQIITVDLPNNALVDLSTFTMYFRGATTGNCTFSKDIETVIERLEVEINGQLVGMGCNYYNQVWKIVADTTFGEDAANRRAILQNSTAVAAEPSAAQAATQYCIQNWLGFLGSVKPSVLDTALLGNVRVRITLAGTSCLAKAAGVTTESYTLSDIFFGVDTLSIDDGVFYSMHQQFLSSGGVYELVYNNFYTFTSVGGLTQSCKFSLSTQSLNRVWGTFLPQAQFPLAQATAAGVDFGRGLAAGSFIDTATGASTAFTRIGNAGAITWGTAAANQPTTYALSNWQFSINNVYQPTWRPTPEQAWPILLAGMNVAQDTLGGSSRLIKSLAAYQGAFWVAHVELEHGTDDFISGVNTMGSIAQCSFDTSGTVTLGAAVGGGGSNPGTNLMCLCIAQTSATLRVGAGRQIEVIQ